MDAGRLPGGVAASEKSLFRSYFIFHPSQNGEPIMNVSVNYVLGRLGEPSTWAGIAVILSLFGIEFVQRPEWADLVKGAAGLAAALAVLFKEKSA
jgi:hypothetical protein